MDAFARALLVADRILTEGRLDGFVKERYASFDTGAGKAFEDGKSSLEDLCAVAATAGEPEPRSGRQEMLENLIFNAVR
jgi:xylose isomerase